MALIPQTEVHLIRGLQARQDTAFTNLYDAYAPALYGVLLKLVGDQASAEDLLQNAFIRIWTSFHRYDPNQGRLFTWLLAITRNVALNELRDRKLQAQARTNMYEWTNEWTYLSLPEGMVNQSLFTLLTPKYRQIMELVYARGWTKQEIAQELNLPLGTVKTRFRMALLQLKQVFDQDIYQYHLS